MSLINDALKRAKEAQQQAAPPAAPNLEFRPIEPAQLARPNRGLLLPATLAVLALVLLFLVWQWTQRSNYAAPLEVKSRTAVSTPAAPAPQPVAASTAPAPVAPVPTVQPVPDIPTVPSATPTADFVGPVAPSAVSDGTNTPVAAILDSSATNTAAAAQPAPPKPPQVKLQAIVFSRTRPSVMINGKTLFIGDKINGSRVTAIDQESVTLVGAGQTNLVTLSSE